MTPLLEGAVGAMANFAVDLTELDVSVREAAALVAPNPRDMQPAKERLTVALQHLMHRTAWAICAFPGYRLPDQLALLHAVICPLNITAPRPRADIIEALAARIPSERHLGPLIGALRKYAHLVPRGST
jgi:hypothetical protein